MASRLALVTGACGFTGTHMIEYLLSRGDYEIIATDLEKSRRSLYYVEGSFKQGRGDTLAPVYYEDFPAKLGVKFIPADLTQKQTLKPLFDYDLDVIFHIASLYDYFADWEKLYKVNVEGFGNLCELASQSSARMIVWSTCGVYGEIRNPPATEDHPYNPPNLYSRSKMEMEKLGFMYHEQHGLPITIIRPAPMYGPRHVYGIFHILLFIAKLGTVIAPSFYPRSKQLRFPAVHVLDVVRAAEFLSRKPQAIGEAYNVLDDEKYTQAEILEFIAPVLGARVVRIPIWYPIYKILAWVGLRMAKRAERIARRRGKRPKFDVPMVEYITHQYWFSNQKIKSLGFDFLYPDTKQGLWEVIGWYKQHGWLP